VSGIQQGVEAAIQMIYIHPFGVAATYDCQASFLIPVEIALAQLGRFRAQGKAFGFHSLSAVAVLSSGLMFQLFLALCKIANGVW